MDLVGAGPENEEKNGQAGAEGDRGGHEECSTGTFLCPETFNATLTSAPSSGARSPQEQEE